MSFGSRLRKLRKENDMKAEELANKLNTSTSTISHYENNNRKPGLEMIEKMADLFNVSTDYLMDRSDKRRPEWYDELPSELQGFVSKENIDYMKVLFDAKSKGLSANDIEQIIKTFQKMKPVIDKLQEEKE